jgi:predicted O-methyltransferase YrrM
MELINALAELYAERFTSPDEELLNSIYQQTIKTHSHAHMISSPVQGKFLSVICSILQPEHVLEIGTFTGYSALCLAQGLQKNGSLHTIELREEDATRAKENFSISQYNKQIHLHIGNALEIIPQLKYEWDLVFIDADKTGYVRYYELVLPRLSEKGLIIADNVLFHGQVLEETIKGKSAKAIHDFNQYVANDSRTEQVLLTIRDGLLLIKKKKE